MRRSVPYGRPRDPAASQSGATLTISPEPAHGGVARRAAPPRPAAEAHPIEVESYRIMMAEVDFSRWPAPEREVVARMVHASADESFAHSALIGEDAVAAAVGALRAGAPVVCDSAMVAAGAQLTPGAQLTGRTQLTGRAQPAGRAQLTGRAQLAAGTQLTGRAECFLSRVASAPERSTRSAEAMRLAAAAHPEGALWVVGNAPTALAAIMSLHSAGALRPAAVIGLPVGYVGAADAKAALWAGPLRAIAVTNSGRRGGSAVAAAALNALARLANG